MIKKITIILAVFMTAHVVDAQIVGTNLFTYAPLEANTTNNGNAVSLGSVSLPIRVHLIQHSGLTNQTSAVHGTNGLQVNIQASIDGNNWTTVSTYWPARTNATLDSYTPSVQSLTTYLRAQIITTNNVSVGVTTVTPR